MNKAKRHDHPEIHGTGVRIGGRILSIPGYILVREMGRGANATVFEALDQGLGRNVAVKIWSGRGLRRAQAEASKIASMNHPLIVSTYFFGRIEGHPFCVMEMIPGVSGKEWLKRGQPLAARVDMWKIYFDALQYIHASSWIHGDPHLGNLLVATSMSPRNRDRVSAKLADAGTSEFWISHFDIETREATLIFETAGRLFSEENFGKLWRHPPGLNYQETLAALHVVVKYLDNVYGILDWDRQSANAEILADLIMQKPFFDIEVVFSQIKQTEVTTAKRLARRINARLHGLHNVMDASDELSQETFELYEGRARKAIALITERASKGATAKSH